MSNINDVSLKKSNSLLLLLNPIRTAATIIGLTVFLAACSGNSSSGVASYAGNYTAALCDPVDPNDCLAFNVTINTDGLATMTGEALTSSGYGTTVGEVSEEGILNLTSIDSQQKQLRFGGTVTGSGAGKKVADGVLYAKDPVSGVEIPIATWTAACSTSCD